MGMYGLTYSLYCPRGFKRRGHKKREEIGEDTFILAMLFPHVLDQKLTKGRVLQSSFCFAGVEVNDKRSN